MCGLVCPYDWKDFVGTKTKTSVDLYISRWQRLEAGLIPAPPIFIKDFHAKIATADCNDEQLLTQPGTISADSLLFIG
jgi:hypothetical protein